MSAGSQGTISLQHDLYQNAVSAAPNSIDQILAAKTVTPMPVSECIGDPAPYGDSKYRIPPSMSLPHQEYVASSGVVTDPGSGVVTKKNSSPEVSAGLALLSFVMAIGAVLL